MNEHLANEYARATEWNLATLSRLASRKSSSFSDINRQRRICELMLEQLGDVSDDVDWVTGNVPQFPRTKRLLVQRDIWTSLNVFTMDVMFDPERRKRWFVSWMKHDANAQRQRAQGDTDEQP